MAVKSVKVKITGQNLQGINRLLCSSEVQEHMRKAAELVAGDAGRLAGGATFGTDVESTTREWLSVANVWPNSAEAAKSNVKENTLLKALTTSGLHMRKRRPY